MIHRRTLNNGLRVWCVPRPGSQTVALMAILPVGVCTETERNNGISHFVEHMLFTGTERWNEAEVTDVVRRRGGECNAQTAREETIYYLHVAAADLTFGMDWMHQLLFRPTLTEAKFEKERQVIITEKGGENERLRRFWIWLEDHNLGWSTSRAVVRRLFPDSPMLVPIIGTDKTLRGISHQDLLDYYHDYYGPNNMTLLVVGDAEPDTVFELAGHQFADEPARPVPPAPPPIRVVDRPFHVRLHGFTPNHQGQLLVGALLGPNSHPDRYGWWIIGEMLENAYIQEIRYKRGLSYDVQVFTDLYTDVGYFNIYTAAAATDFASILSTVNHHLDRIVAGEFDEAEVREAQAALKGRALLNLQDNLELAWWLTSDTLIYQDEDTPVADYIAEIERQSPVDLERIARRYLASERRFSVEQRTPVTPQQLRPLATVIGLASAALLISQRRRMRDERKPL